LEYEYPTPAGDSRNKTFAAEEKILKRKIRTPSGPVLKEFKSFKKNKKLHLPPSNYLFFFFLQYPQIFQFLQCPFRSIIDVAINVTFPQSKMIKISLEERERDRGVFLSFWVVLTVEERCKNDGS
jgi:hypothetical protein